jgi:quercetin dioxygenase-like cupin family protein
MTPSETLIQEGFTHVYLWHDAPHTEYEEHTHRDRVTIFVTHGEVTFCFKDQTNRTVKKGERFDVPPGIRHTATVGKDGCSYVVGEMIDGDS